MCPIVSFRIILMCVRGSQPNGINQLTALVVGIIYSLYTIFPMSSVTVNRIQN